MQLQYHLKIILVGSITIKERIKIKYLCVMLRFILPNLLSGIEVLSKWVLKMNLKGLSFRELKDVLQGACRFTERKIVSLFL